MGMPTSAASVPVLEPIDERRVRFPTAVRAIAQTALADLFETIETASMTPGISAEQQRALFLGHFQKLRAMFARLYVLTTWSLDHQHDVPVVLDSLRQIRDRQRGLAEASDSLILCHSATFKDRELAYDIGTAFDVLATGTLPAAPSGIGNVFRKTPGAVAARSPQDAQKIVELLSHFVRRKLLKTAVPTVFTQCRMEDGRALLTCPGLFSVLLTLDSLSEDANWVIVADSIRFLVGVSGAQESPVGKWWKPEMTQHLTRKMTEAAADPLAVLATVLPAFCIESAVAILRQQCQILLAPLQRFVRVIWKDSDLYVAYWPQTTTPRLVEDEHFLSLEEATASTAATSTATTGATVTGNRSLFLGIIKIVRRETRLAVVRISASAPSQGLQASEGVPVDVSRLNVAAVVLNAMRDHAVSRISMLSTVLEAELPAGLCQKMSESESSAMLSISLGGQVELIRQPLLPSGLLLSMDFRSGVLTSFMSGADGQVSQPAWLSALTGSCCGVGSTQTPSTPVLSASVRKLVVSARQRSILHQLHCVLSLELGTSSCLLAVDSAVCTWFPEEVRRSLFPAALLLSSEQGPQLLVALSEVAALVPSFRVYSVVLSAGSAPRIPRCELLLRPEFQTPSEDLIDFGSKLAHLLRTSLAAEVDNALLSMSR